MMTVDPKKRITIKQVLLHPWLQDHFMRNTVHSLINYDKDENCPPINLLTDDRYKHDTYAGLLKRPRIEL